MDNLTYLLATYFHQDWNHTHTSWEGVVDEFANNDRHLCANVLHEIDRLLAEPLDDAELSRALVGMGCDYAPTEGDRTWLMAVRDRIQGQLEAR